MRIRIRQQQGFGQPWRPLADTSFEQGDPVLLPVAVTAESDRLAFQFQQAEQEHPPVRVYVGSVLAASSLASDRVVLIDHDEASDERAPLLVCRGNFLLDWVGLTELVVQVRQGESWQQALVLPLAITAGKLTSAQFDQLFAELERDSAGALLDIHGKTYLGLKGGQPLAPSTPIAVLGRARETVTELDELLHRMARNPASRLRTTLSREQAFAGQAVSDATLAEACRDPGILAKSGGRLVFREHVRERSHADYRLGEHQLIADFIEYLEGQLADLRERIDAEVIERQERKSWRNRAREPDKPTWWESEDLPRIEELQRCRQEVVRLRARVRKWCGLPFLPPGRVLNQKPQSTPLFRNHPVYRRVFRAIAGHFQTYQATLDNQPLLTRAKSLPVLYEWWCAVQVIRILARGLAPLAHDPLNRPIIAPRLAPEGKRFTIEFTWDQVISFTDGQGARVRFRYQPEYLPAGTGGPPSVGILDTSLIRTPDMAIEVCPARAGAPDLPELIIVLDAKYSSASQAEKMIEVSTKYSKIGDARTGRVLSRQVWALTPAAPVGEGWAEGLRKYCTVDNRGFWSQAFDVSNPVNGAIQTRPVAPGAFDPLQALLAALLRRVGVDYADRPAQG
jgi:hypothetical protein